jgi:sporulation protein YlmC with PRC-barrel domain
MKKLLALVIVPALALTLSLDASAQTTKADKHNRAARTAAAADIDALHSSKAIIGTKIEDAQGKSLGKVEELLIDPKTGKVDQVVVGLGGMMGVGEKKVVVPWSDMKMQALHEGKRAVITMDRSRLESAPTYDRKTAATDRRAPAASPATGRNEDSLHKAPIGQPEGDKTQPAEKKY